MTSPPLRDCIPLADLARANNLTTRCVKRRLLKLHKRRLIEHPDAPHLLSQFADHGHYFANRIVLQKLAPGLLDGGEEIRLARIEATLTRLSDDLVRIEAKLDELLDVSVTIRSHAVRRP